MSELRAPFSRLVRLNTKLPKVDVPSRSYAMRVRDGMVDRMQAMPFFQGFHFVRTKNYAVQAQDVPHAGVFFIDEALTGDGDIRAGVVRFASTVQIGFSIIVQNNDPEKAELKLDDAHEAITNGLLRDTSLHLNPLARIQAYSAGRRMHVFGAVGKDNELPIAELQLTLSCELGVLTFEPFIPDMLEVVHVTTVYPDDDPNRQPVISEYDIPTE